MNVLFVLLHLPNTLDSGNMYLDLIMEFRDDGHNVSIITSSDTKTTFGEEFGVEVLRVKSLPILYVSNVIQKGIGMALMPFFFSMAYKKYYKKRMFDWIIMPTPPITLIDFVKRIKRKTKAKLYLILRDIHPQSSESLGELKYKWMFDYLYKKSDLAYRKSDVIGCMSQANIDFIKKHHDIPQHVKCTVLYNWMSFTPYKKTDSEELRAKYGLENKFIVLFGGNIGLGQRIENIIDLAQHYKKNDNIVFAVIGKGVKKAELQNVAKHKNLDNILFIDYMPRTDYLNFVKSVDLGLISIHENNAVPTCPSKVISYMALKLPVLALINSNSDYGKIIEYAGAGFWSVGSDKKNVYSLFDKIYNDPELRYNMGEAGYKFYVDNLTTKKVYSDLIKQIL